MLRRGNVYGLDFDELLSMAYVLLAETLASRPGLTPRIVHRRLVLRLEDLARGFLGLVLKHDSRGNRAGWTRRAGPLVDVASVLDRSAGGRMRRWKERRWQNQRRELKRAARLGHS